MAESNSSWGELVEYDSDLATVWDEIPRLPEPGAHAELDAFVARKRITHAALVRAGARMTEDGVLAFAGPGYVKFRRLSDGRRWAAPGCMWSKLRIVKGSSCA